VNGHEVTYLDKIIAKYKLWRIQHGWGYKPYGKYTERGPHLTPLKAISDYRYKLEGPELLESEAGTFSTIMRTASKWAVVIGILYEGYNVTKEVYQMKMVRIPAHSGRRFRSMPATHSGQSPAAHSGASRPSRERVEATLDSASPAVLSWKLDIQPGGSRWLRSDYPCARFERSFA
jgi:hypothetical protein